MLGLWAVGLRLHIRSALNTHNGAGERFDGAAPVAGVVAAVGGIAWGLGSAIVRFTSSPSIEKKVTDAIKAERKLNKKRDCDNLRQSLSGDEASLLDEILGLQSLIESTSTTDIGQGELMAATVELLDQSYQSLFKIPMLNNLQKTIKSSKSATKVVVEQKRRIYDDAKENIDYVANVIAEFQTIGTTARSQEDVRKQLTSRLVAAKEFAGQLQTLSLGGLGPEQLDKYAKAG
jgi:hypothetical protein